MTSESRPKQKMKSRYLPAAADLGSSNPGYLAPFYEGGLLIAVTDGASAPASKYLTPGNGVLPANVVPVNNDTVAWIVSGGPYPYRQILRVPDVRLEKLGALRKTYKDPVQLICSAPRVIDGNSKQGESDSFTVKNLFLLPGEPAGDVYFQIPIVNCWYWYHSYFVWTKRYNMRRTQNDIESLDKQSRLTFRKDNYLQYSLNGDKPWTALEILVDILRGIDATYGVQWFDDSSISTITDNGYIPDDREYIRAPAAQLVDEMASMAYVGIRVDLDGKIRLYPRTSTVFSGIDEQQRVDADETAFIPYESIRPSAIDVGFTTLVEVFLTTAPNQQGNTSPPPKNQILPYLVNVMKIPTSISAEAVSNAWGELDSTELASLGEFKDTLRKYGAQRGTWLPISCAIKFRNQQDTLDAAGDPFKDPWFRLTETLSTKFKGNEFPGLSEPLITRCWFGSQLEVFYGMANFFNPNIKGAPEYMDQVRLMWAGAIRQHLYQTYRIWPDYLQNLVTWMPKRAGLVDAVYRVMLESPVYTEFCIFPRAYPPLNAEMAKQYTGQNVDHTTGIPTTLGKFLGRTVNLGRFVNPKLKAVIGDDFAQHDVSPFSISPIDVELGVFRVEPFQDLEGVVGRIEPAFVENMIGTDYNLTPQGQFLEMASWVKSTKKLKTIVSVVPALPNGDQQLYSIVVTPNAVGEPKGNGPIRKIVSQKEMCRIRVDQKIVNKEMLEDIARAEASTILASFKDRTSGVLKYGGAALKANLVGFQKSITYVGSVQGIKTYQDFTEYPEPPPFFTLISFESRKLVFRQLWDRR